MVPDPLCGPFESLMASDRETASLVVQFLTGHNLLNYHEFLVGRSITPTCRLCQGSEETSAHLLWVCPTLARKRLDYWLPNEGELPKFNILVKFLKNELCNLLRK